jgi:hypothetical protein
LSEIVRQAPAVPSFPAERASSHRQRRNSGLLSRFDLVDRRFRLSSGKRLGAKPGISGLISSAERVLPTCYLRPRRLKMYIGGGVLLLILIILLIIFLL